jgi:hypothetical protein
LGPSDLLFAWHVLTIAPWIRLPRLGRRICRLHFSKFRIITRGTGP